MTADRRASGCLFGLALGDALGAATEFLSIAEIVRKFPPHGPTEPATQVTDDTQMTLCVGEVLLEALRPYTPPDLEPRLRQAFVGWSKSPENNRGPGRTCMGACRNLSRGRPWYEATVATSKGCGANMRVAPVGLLPDGSEGVSDDARAAIAQFQAAMTHGHPTGLAAADVTAQTIRLLRQGISLAGLLQQLRDYVRRQRSVYHEAWLGPLWRQDDWKTPQQFIETGWDECLQSLDRLEAALVRPDRDADPCQATGEGWVAEEAFATGLLCFLLFPEDPVAAIRRAAVTSGDSDSIACLTGAFAGAYHGLAAWPQGWRQQIEYRDRLARLGTAWD